MKPFLESAIAQVLPVLEKTRSPHAAQSPFPRSAEHSLFDPGRHGSRIAPPAAPLTAPLTHVLPLLRSGDPAGSVSVFESEPIGLAVEQFRLMQRRLRNVRPHGGVLLITSPGPGDGKSVNAHNLAWALAEAALPTLLLELDLRRPTQARYLRTSTAPTLVEVLAGSIPPDDALRQVGTLPLYFLGLHAPAPHPIETLRSPALQELLAWARQTFSWVVIDAPPVLPVADVEELLPAADLVLMIVRQRYTPRTMVERAADRLGRRLDYLVFNAVEPHAAYGYAYQYK